MNTQEREKVKEFQMDENTIKSESLWEYQRRDAVFNAIQLVFIWRRWNIRSYMVSLTVNVQLCLHLYSSCASEHRFNFICVVKREPRYFLPCERAGKFFLLFVTAGETCCRLQHPHSSIGGHKQQFTPAPLCNYCLDRERALTEHKSSTNLASLCHLLLPRSWS